MRLSKWRDNFHFWVNYPFKTHCISFLSKSTISRTNKLHREMATKQKVSHQCLFRVQSPIMRSSVSLLSWHRIDSEWTQWTLFIPADPPYSYPSQCWDRAAASTASAIKICTVYNFGFANGTQKHTHRIIQVQRSSSPPCVLRCTLWSLILCE